jgi:hypothetical protein
MHQNAGLTALTVAYVELEALDISNIHKPGAEEASAKQVVGFINKNGMLVTTSSIRDSSIAIR